MFFKYNESTTKSGKVILFSQKRIIYVRNVSTLIKSCSDRLKKNFTGVSNHKFLKPSIQCIKYSFSCYLLNCITLFVVLLSG